jgi:hypothetical protein
MFGQRGTHLSHRPSRFGAPPDLTGAYGIGRRRDWNPLTAERQLAEQFGFMVNGVLRRAAPILRQNVIRDRMSNPTPIRGRGGYIKINAALGVRKRKENLQKSVRMTVTTPGTTARGFRGVFRLSSHCGGSRAHYAGILEAAGKLQFKAYTTQQYVPIVEEIRSAAAAIGASFGGTVR